MLLCDDLSEVRACGKHLRNLRVSSPYFLESIIKYQRRVMSGMDCCRPRGLPRPQCTMSLGRPFKKIVRCYVALLFKAPTHTWRSVQNETDHPIHMRISWGSVCLRFGGFLPLTNKPSSACALLDAPVPYICTSTSPKPNLRGTQNS